MYALDVNFTYNMYAWYDCHFLRRISMHNRRESIHHESSLNYWYFFHHLSCRFYFDFSPTYVGCGLICPHIVNCSCLLGAIISWGFFWPLISQRAGDWYPAGLESNDFKGLYGYKVLHLFYILTSKTDLLESSEVFCAEWMDLQLRKALDNSTF